MPAYTMSHNNARGRLGGVDSQSAGGVHMEMEGAVWRLTVDCVAIYILVRRQ